MQLGNYIKVYDKAVKYTRLSTYYPPKEKIARRGTIKTFSAHSRLRLREKIAQVKLNDCQSLYGLTLTLPWQVSQLQQVDYLEEYKKLFNRFCVSLRRSFPSSAAIFRHELQKRKIPHCHIIFYLSKLDGYSSEEFQSQIKYLWFNSLQGNLYGGSLRSFTKYGVKIDSLEDNNLSLFRYISDHTSKSKQAQLGYQGKQWGIINNKAFTITQPFIHKFRTDYERIYFSRTVRNVCRFSVSIEKSKKQNLKKSLFKSFKTKKVRTNSNCSLRFINSKTIHQLLLYLSRNN